MSSGCKVKIDTVEKADYPQLKPLIPRYFDAVELRSARDAQGTLLGFYRHIGFSVRGRSPLDGQGKPYPLLHMTLLTP
jgi:hypothetical protein